MQFIIDAEAQLLDSTRTELSPYAALLGQVIALAADDCRRALKAPAFNALSDREMIEAASAASFLLSTTCRFMISVIGLEPDAIRLSAALGNATLARLNLNLVDIDATPEQWCRAIELATRSATVGKAVTPLSRVVRYRQESFHFALAG